jgi:sialate O-acetylesterase
MNFYKTSLVALIVIFMAKDIKAKDSLNVSRIFTNNMVVQRNTKLPVWGWTKPGNIVTVKFKGQKASAKAELDGKWMVMLSPLKADLKPAEMKIISHSKTVVLSNILVGEVWLCSGQSNMQFSLIKVPDSKKQIEKANHRNIRLFNLEGKSSDIPRQTLTSSEGWQVCSPETSKEFSAIGYFFGLELFKKLNVPIGLIDNSRGGTCAEAWISYEGIKADKRLNAVFIRHIEMMKKDKFNKRVIQWQKDISTWKSFSKTKRKKWPVIKKWWKKIRAPYGYPGNPDSPSCLFNRLVNPLIPYAIKGVIWYQGESNVPRGKEYEYLFPALISDWRKRWERGNFPFYFVQISPCKEFIDYKLTDLWISQYNTLKTVKNTGMVSPIDYGDVNDPHPKRKKPVGIRLANMALAKTYGLKGLVYKSPSFYKQKVEGSKIRIIFKNINGGGLCSNDGKDLSWFEISGKDKKFHKAKADINGNAVLVYSDKVNNPAFVRFAWSSIAEPNLNDNAGLPVLPFSTEK